MTYQPLPFKVSSVNSSSTPLAGGATFTGTSEKTEGYGVIYVNVTANVASATDGLSIQQSSDGTNWDHTDDFTISAGATKNFSINAHSKYYRVVYTNGGSVQASFRLQTILKINGRPSSHRVQDAIADDDDAELVKSVITSEDPSGVVRNIKGTEDNSSGLSIAEGKVTGKTFIHKFGEAPDFDTGDLEVTIWDGADDALLSGAAMKYTYSTSADIDTISSSNNGDTVDIEIEGLDTNWALVTQTITLTGQTDATLTTALIRVFRMKNVGATDLSGVVYLRTNGSSQTLGVPDTASTVRAIINNGNNQTLMALYTIPAAKTGYLRDWYAAIAGASKTSNYKIRLKARPSGQVFQLKHTSALSENGSSSIQHKYEEPEVFAAQTDIELTAQITANSITAANISGGFDIVLVDD
jgi:hypothetical protein